MGWCQYGSPEELPRIKSRREYERTAIGPPDWRIGCCYVSKGYPELAGAVPAGFLFNGALSTYEQLGFTKDRMIGKHRWVVNRFVE